MRHRARRDLHQCPFCRELWRSRSGQDPVGAGVRREAEDLAIEIHHIEPTLRIFAKGGWAVQLRSRLEGEPVGDVADRRRTVDAPRQSEDVAGAEVGEDIAALQRVAW